MEMQSGFRKFICDKPFMKAVLAVAIPMMLQQVIASSVNLVDNLMVGQLGDAAIGAVAAVNRYYMIALYGTNGLTAAASVFIAQYYGAQKPEKMKESFRFMLIVALGIMCLFCFLGIGLSRPILQFFTSDEAVIQSGIAYIRIAAVSFLPTALTLSIYSSVRAVGETKLPLICSSAAVATNTFLNWCLIFGNLGFPKLGVAGAAIATLIARCVELGLAMTGLFRGSFGFKTVLSDLLKIPADIARRIITKAAPLMLNEILWSAGMAALFKFYSSRGSQIMSGYSIASTIGDIFFTLFAGMAAASTVFISQPLGANKLDEARKHGYWLLGFSVLLSFFFAALMYASTFAVPYLYSQISTYAKQVTVRFLTVESLMFWLYMATCQCYFILRSGGDMKHTLIMDSCFMWAVNIPVVFILTYYTKLPYLTVYICGQLTDVIKLFFAYHLVSKEKWVVNLTISRESDGV